MFRYLKEIKLVTIYISISFFLAFAISFNKLASLIVFIYYPIVKIFHKKLLILHILDLINSSFLLSINISSFFSVISFNYFLKLFFFPSWYKVQKNMFTSFFLNLVIFLFFYFFIFLFFYALIIHFLLIWDLKTFNSYKLFDIQFQLFNFIQFQLDLFFSSLLILLIIFTFCVNLKWFITWKYIYTYIKLFKNLFRVFLFLIIFLFFYDLFFQSLILLFMYLFFEFIYFFMCFKLISFC